MTQEVYNLASFIAICAGFLVTVGSLWFLARQILVSQRTRETDILMRLYELSTRHPLDTDFEVVWSLRGKKRITNEQKESCLRATLFFEMVGSVVSQRYMGTVLIEEYFGSLITGSYDALRDYLENERKKPYNGNFGLNFERLAIQIGKSKRISRSPGTHPIHQSTKPGSTTKPV